MSDLVERLEYCEDQRDRWREKALELEAGHERAVRMVIEAGGIATGHADTSADLMTEVLHVVKNLRFENERLKAALAEWKPCPHCGEYTYRKLPEKQP